MTACTAGKSCLRSRSRQGQQAEDLGWQINICTGIASNEYGSRSPLSFYCSSGVYVKPFSIQYIWDIGKVDLLRTISDVITPVYFKWQMLPLAAQAIAAHAIFSWANKLSREILPVFTLYGITSQPAEIIEFCYPVTNLHHYIVRRRWVWLKKLSAQIKKIHYSVLWLQNKLP